MRGVCSVLTGLTAVAALLCPQNSYAQGEGMCACAGVRNEQNPYRNLTIGLQGTFSPDDIAMIDLAVAASNRLLYDAGAGWSYALNNTPGSNGDVTILGSNTLPNNPAPYFTPSDAHDGSGAILVQGNYLNTQDAEDGRQAFLENVVTHELGHSMGLGHNTKCGPANSMMWPTIELGLPAYSYKKQFTYSDECVIFGWDDNFYEFQCGDQSEAARVCAYNNPGGWWDYWLCECCGGSSPILLSLDGGPVRLTFARGGVDFDINGDGIRTRIAWTEPKSRVAFLMLDRNGNGLADNGLELFGNYTLQPGAVGRNGFKALAVLDTAAEGGNEDGVVDARDKGFSALRLWLDSNHNGVCEPSEVMSLEQAGIVGFSLEVKKQAKRDQFGNLFAYRAQVLTLDARIVWAWDVYFATQR